MAYGQLAGIDAATGLTGGCGAADRLHDPGSQHPHVARSGIDRRPGWLPRPWDPLPPRPAFRSSMPWRSRARWSGWCCSSDGSSRHRSWRTCCPPILIGYLTGVAILAMISQLPKMLGYDVDTSSLVGLWDTNWQLPDGHTLAISLIVAGISLGRRFVSKKIPVHLIGLDVHPPRTGWDVPKAGTVTPSRRRHSCPASHLDAVVAHTVPAWSIAVVSTPTSWSRRGVRRGGATQPGPRDAGPGWVQAATGLDRWLSDVGVVVAHRARGGTPGPPPGSIDLRPG